MTFWHHTKRISTHVTKKTGHILFPYLWHYFTDEYKDRIHHLVVDTILSFFILGLLASNIVLGIWFYLFSIHPEVEASVSVPEVVISGATLETGIQFQPINKTISDVQLKLITPAGYQIDGPTTWQWDRLAAGDQQAITVPGHFTGTVGEQYRVILLYQYKYFGQSFDNYVTAEFKVDTSSLEVVTTLPDQILNQESFTWQVEYHNSSDFPREGVCIKLDIPEAFVVESSSLPITDGQITLERLEARAGGTIDITGSFKNAIGEGSQVIGVAGIDGCGVKEYRQVTLSNPIQVLTPRLQITTTGPSLLNVGQAGYYTVRYTNTGDATLSTVNIVVTLNNFSGHATMGPSGDGSSNGNILRWTDTNLAPGETRSQTFTAYTNASMREKNIQMSYTASATADIADLGVSTYTPVVSGPITKFNSTLFFTHAARYSSANGEQLGYGPYPPQAWNVTALRVFWQVEDFTNDLSNVTISTTLPSQVEWTGHDAVTEGGAMTYDPATRRVTWHTGSITSFSHPQGASFEVRILPNSDQIGQRIHITNDTLFTARDSFTGVVLSRGVGALVTEPIQPEE